MLAAVVSPGVGGSVSAQVLGGGRATTATVGQALAADLTWTEVERDQRFGRMDAVFPTRRVRRAGTVRVLPPREPLGLDARWVEQTMASQRLAGLLVLQDGRVRLERYGLGATDRTLWTGFSLTKAVTDTLAGVALHRGQIHSLNDGVSTYLPELKRSGYDGVNVRQLMTMTSGVRWRESYTTSDADNVRLYATRGGTLEYMRRLPREAAPGTRWLYNTGETDLLGVLLRRATGKTLAEQLSTAVWQRAGMERDATWIATARNAQGEEFGGSGLSATLRDWSRLGLWVIEGGKGAVEADWFAEATKPQVRAGAAGYGYGWWPQPDGSFAALGIFGQSMLLDPRRKLVVVMLGDWPTATDPALSAERAGFWQCVKASIDGEGR